MIHIFGANGFIGSKLCNELDCRSIKYDCYSNASDKKCRKFDLLTDDTSALFFSEKDVVVLLAAISSPDICQNDYELAYSVNVLGTSRLIDYCIANKVNVIFMSSDTVNGPTCNENDEYSPVNPYGNYAKMKYEIEKKYMNSPYFKTLRLSYVLSNSDKFTSYLNECVIKNKVAEVFRGLFRNVIKLEIVIETIIKLCEKFDFNDYYLINVSGNQNLSRLDLAKWYKLFINNSLMYREIEVPKEILKGRPNVIKTRSLFLEKLLGHKIENLLNEGDY